jgi:hypothetical protein
MPVLQELGRGSHKWRMLKRCICDEAEGDGFSCGKGDNDKPAQARGRLDLRPIVRWHKMPLEISEKRRSYLVSGEERGDLIRGDDAPLELTDNERRMVG